MKTAQLLTDFLKKKWYIYASGLTFIAAANIAQAYFPRLLGQFTDELEQGLLTSTSIVEYSLLLVLVGVSFAVLGGIGQFHIMYVGRRFEFFTRNRLFDHFTKLSESFYSKNGVGKLLSYVMNDVTTARESISMGVHQSATAILLLLSTIFMMLFSDIPPLLILACVFPMLFIPWMIIRFGPTIRHRSMNVQQSLGAMTQSAEEQFGGIRVTKKFAVEQIMNARFGHTVDTLRDHQLQLVRVSSIFQALIPFLGACSLVITLGLGGYMTIKQQISIGDFIALTLYIRLLANPLQLIGNVINTMQRSRASLARLNTLLMQQSDIQEHQDAVAFDVSDRSIHITHLTFSYPDSNQIALDDIELYVAPGQTIGIIGKTGSGKTTLVKMLLRIYDPPAGTIGFGRTRERLSDTLNDTSNQETYETNPDITDIRHMTLESLRNQIAYVPQDGFLFSMSIRQNIAFHHRDTTIELVEEAARQAQIYEDIQHMPGEFDAKLGERGVTLSGGQKQRTALARGLIKHAPIMILDDSVSAVDALTESKLITQLQKQRKNLTTFIVAHRISAIEHADLIIVMDKGRIVQRGTHHELLQQQGIYASLYDIQVQREG